MTTFTTNREPTMQIQQIHHVAYRCRNAKETVQWYGRHLNIGFVLAIAEDHVPSTHEPDPYMHVFLDAGQGNVLAFFELPNAEPMARDPNTPAWVQHIAFQVADEAALLVAKKQLEAGGVEVLGVTDHTLFKSIYFFDPNGHRIELAAPTTTPEMLARIDCVKWDMLDEWDRTKRAPRHASWMHERELAGVTPP